MLFKIIIVIKVPYEKIWETAWDKANVNIYIYIIIKVIFVFTWHKTKKDISVNLSVPFLLWFVLLGRKHELSVQMKLCQVKKTWRLTANIITQKATILLWESLFIYPLFISNTYLCRPLGPRANEQPPSPSPWYTRTHEKRAHTHTESRATRALTWVTMAKSFVQNPFLLFEVIRITHTYTHT